MKGPYDKYPGIAAMSIKGRIDALSDTCVNAMSTRSGIAHYTPEKLLSFVDDAIEEEQYEMAEAYKRAIERFNKNPQLSLFLFEVTDKDLQRLRESQ